MADKVSTARQQRAEAAARLAAAAMQYKEGVESDLPQADMRVCWLAVQNVYSTCVVAEATLLDALKVPYSDR